MDKTEPVVCGRYKCLYCNAEFDEMPEDGICPECQGTDIIDTKEEHKTIYKDKNVIFHPVENNSVKQEVRLFPITMDTNLMDRNGRFICENGIFGFGSTKGIYFIKEKKNLDDLLKDFIIPNPIDAPTDTLYRLKIGDKVWSLGGGGGSSIDAFIVTNLDYFYNVGTDVAGLSVSLTNFTSKEEKTEQKIIGLADTSHSGFMSPKDVKAISDLQQEVKRLEGDFRIIVYSNEGHPEWPEYPKNNDEGKAAIKAFAYSQEPDETKWGSIEIVSFEDATKTKQLAWYYVTYYDVEEEIEKTEWVVDTSDYTSLFTNKTPGSILGTDGIDGKVYAENDGSGSVYGWDRLNEKVNKNTEEITNVKTNKQDILLIDNEQDKTDFTGDNALDYNKYLKLVINAITKSINIELKKIANREPEYRAYIETHQVPVQIIFTDINMIVKTNDAENIKIFGNSITLNIPGKFELNVQNGVAIIYNLDF